jgi:lipopolysaccharide export LptBFGC system permease protein LptF
MEIDLTQIAAALISLMAGVVTGYIIPWIKAKAGLARWTQLQNVALTAVRSAEQLHDAGLITTKKITWAESQARAALLAQGLTFDDDVITSAIEAAVLIVNRELFTGEAKE